MVDQAALISVAKDFAVPIVAAVLGALLGYVPAALLARRSSKELLVRDAQQRRESELTEARRAFVKLTLLANTLGSYRDQIEAMVAKATADGNDHMTLSQRLSTFAGVEEEPIIEFDASELAPFIAAAKPEVVDALLLLQRRYAAVVQGLRAFARMKTELHFGLARVGETSRGPDLVSTTRAKVPLELSNIFRLKAQELEWFAGEMRQQVHDYADYSVDVSSLFGDACDGYYGGAMIPRLVPNAQTEAKARVSR